MTVDIIRNPIDNEKYDVNITMEQKQNFPDVPELFKTLIRFDILQNDNGNVAYHKEEFYNDKKVQTFTATYDFIPDTVMFDFTYALAEVDTTSYHITSVEEMKSIRDLPFSQILCIAEVILKSYSTARSKAL
jgi:hypothetical protein